MLGYYADILFVQNMDAFKNAMQFLITSIGKTDGINEVIARGCVDTIAIVVTDQDVAPRLTEFLDFIVSQLVDLLASVSFVNFFDFMNDFIKLFATALKGTPVLNLMSATVKRICNE